jgi:hypothetical protein
VSPVEQTTIDCEYLAYFIPKKIEKKNLLKRYYATFLCGRYNIFLKKNFAPENMKNLPLKISHNQP